jgi:uncharacterized protein YndB with AHSA1/START domain
LAQAARRKVTLERTFRAPIHRVWELWTTKAGIESWWGPEGFSVQVQKLDLRPGGELLYAMTATAPEQVDFMKKAGMPVTTESRLTYAEVVPPRRLAYSQQVDFIPNVKTYDIETTVDLEPAPNGVRMVVTFDAMHDEQWTQMAVMGHEGELRKLETLLTG